MRLLVAGMYALLLLGAATMLYPFGLMLAGSTKSAADDSELALVPRFLTDSTALYRKHVEALFNESLLLMNATYGATATSFQRVEPPEEINDALIAPWEEFLRQAQLGPDSYAVGHLATPVSWKAVPRNLRTLKQQLADRFAGDIAALNRELETEFGNWNAVYVDPGDYLLRRVRPPTGPMGRFLREFKEGRAQADRYYFSIQGYYRAGFLMAQYGKEISAYNASHGTTYPAWEDVHLDPVYPAAGSRTERERQDWVEFVGKIVNLLWIRADPAAAPLYRNFLEAKYGTIAILNRDYGTRFAGFEEVPLIEAPPASGLVLSDWDAFVQGWRDPASSITHQLPPAMIHLHGPDILFRDFLQRRYGTVESLNAALGTHCAAWADIEPPQRALHYREFLKDRAGIRIEFIRRNYVTVIDYVALRGRAIANTALYCLLAILCALTFNPLAAYALSRYRPPSAWKYMLFLMLTMAFPPMITQIPVFLMLRQLHLLNTFWALILPGLANGYSIFLLKGFFDSQPRELYETAAIDGAGELRIFWQIAMSLSRPILAVIALHAFTAAYSNFMMALLICQDERMWTLMPWLFQLQQRCAPGVVYASLLVAALPTFAMFVLCQKIIMRGIVVPVEK